MRVVLGIVLLLIAVSPARGVELPRRSFLGLSFDLSDRSGPGLYVASVASGSTAAKAGIRIGDRLTSVGGIDSLDSYPALRDELARTALGERIDLRYYRGANTVIRAAPPLGPLPAEQVAGGRVRYAAVAAGGSRLRLILTEPDGAASGLIFYLQGPSCDSLDFWEDAEHPVKRLIDGWTTRGFATARLEKRGVGDSDGPPCDALDFAEEQRGYLAALEHLTGLGFGGRVLLFGHGVGGIQASQLATDAVAGIMVYGTPVFEAPSPEALIGRLSAAAGLPDENSTEAVPSLGRPQAYFVQLAACDSERSWRQVWQPVLALHGSHDGTAARTDLQRIARWTGGRFQSLPGLGSDFLRYDTAGDALLARGTGTFDPAILDATLTWVRTLTDH